MLGLLAVGVSAMGFMFGLSGEMWRMPVLWRYAHRVPIDAATIDWLAQIQFVEWTFTGAATHSPV